MDGMLPLGNWTLQMMALTSVTARNALTTPPCPPPKEDDKPITAACRVRASDVEIMQHTMRGPLQ